jgi:hypothetical protein
LSNSFLAFDVFVFNRLRHKGLLLLVGARILVQVVVVVVVWVVVWVVSLVQSRVKNNV